MRRRRWRPLLQCSSGPPTSGRRAAPSMPLRGALRTDHGARLRVARGPGGRRPPVEVDGDAEAAPDLQTGLAGEDRALGDGDACDGHEGDDVGGADARMDAVLSGEIDEFGGLAGGADRGFDDGGRECRRW